MAGVEEQVIVYPLLARIATPAPSAFNDLDHARLGGHFVISTTAIGAAPSVVFNIEAQDPLSLAWYPILISAAVIAISTTVLRVYPSFTPAANLTAADILPPIWRVRPVHGNADSITYSMSAFLRN